jgi:hypothetical protein
MKWYSPISQDEMNSKDKIIWQFYQVQGSKAGRKIDEKTTRTGLIFCTLKQEKRDRHGRQEIVRPL